MPRKKLTRSHRSCSRASTLKPLPAMEGRLVQLADRSGGGRKAHPELARDDGALEHAAARLQLEHLLDLKSALHGVADDRAVPADCDIDRPGRIGERAL